MNRGLHKISSPDTPVVNEKPYNLVKLEDEFVSGLGTSGNIGSLGWLLGAGSVTNGVGTQYIGHTGLIQLSSGTTANVRGRILLQSVSVSANEGYINSIRELHMLARPNTTFTTSGSLRFGMMSPFDINTTNEGSTGIYLSTLAADTNWFLKGIGSRIDTGVPRSVTEWLLFSAILRKNKIPNTGASVVYDFFVNEKYIASGNSFAGASDTCPAFVAETNNTTAKTMLIDYFYCELEYKPAMKRFNLKRYGKE